MQKVEPELIDGPIAPRREYVGSGVGCAPVYSAGRIWMLVLLSWLATYMYLGGDAEVEQLSAP